MKTGTAFAFSLSSATPLALEDGKSDAWVDIAKLGEWKGYVDPETGKKRTVKITPAHFESAMAEFSRNSGGEFVMDYEHQSMSGGEAPASGWIDELKVEGEKLRGHVTFTDRAAAAIRAREYKYTSPVWSMGMPDRVTGDALLAQIPCVALTNTPFQGGLRPVSLSRFVRMTQSIPTPEGSALMTQEELQALVDSMMKALGVTDPKTLLAAVEQLVGVGGKTEDAPMSVPVAMSRLKSRDGEIASMKRELGDAKTALEAANGELAKNAKATKDAADAALEKEAVSLVDERCIAMGRALPGQRDFYLGVARSNVAAFKAHVETMPEVVPMSKRAIKQEAKPLGSIDAAHPVIASFKRSGWSDQKIADWAAKNPEKLAAS